MERAAAKDVKQQDGISRAAELSVASTNRRKRAKQPKGRAISERQLVEAFSVAFEVSGQGNTDLDSNTLGLMLAIGGLDEDVNRLFDSGIFRTKTDAPYNTRTVTPRELLRWLRVYGKRWFQMRFEILLGEMEARVREERRIRARFAEVVTSNATEAH